MIEHNKEAYYLALRQTQGSIRTDSPNWQPWLMFFLRALAEQVKRLEKKVEREKLVLAPLPELSLQIIEFVREHGRITIGEATILTGANRNTLRLGRTGAPRVTRQRSGGVVRVAVIGNIADGCLGYDSSTLRVRLFLFAYLLARQ